MNKVTVVFIALDAGDKYYKQYYKKLKNFGFNLVLVNLKWNYKNINDWIEQSIAILNSIQEPYIIVGHSVGASISLMLQNKLKHLPIRMILYSPSPIFNEFIKNFDKEVLQFFGKRRIKQIEENHIRVFLKNNTIPLEVRYGSLEHPYVKVTVRTIKKFHKDATINEYKNTDHMSSIYASNKLP